MKTTIYLLIAAMLLTAALAVPGAAQNLAASSSLTAQRIDCSNMTLKGTWANSIHGQLFLPDGSTLLIDGIVKTTYDGEGNFTQVDAVADNGNITPGWRPGSGTYTVNPDCTGTSTVVVPGMPDLHLQFIVSPSGNTSHFVVVDRGFATAGDSERISR